MLNVQKDSRQMPKDIKYTAEPKYCDIMYGYLQQISFYDGTVRYIPKRDISFVRLAEDLQISRQTAAKRFKGLQELGLIQTDDENGYYILTLLSKQLAALVPKKTLEVLVATLNERTISVYIYLLNRYIANKGQPFLVTYTQIKTYVGLSEKTRSNNNVIKDILAGLQVFGLLKYAPWYADGKSILKVFQVENELKLEEK